MKTILLTGGNGFIGKNICESYLAQKYTILAPGRKELDVSDENETDNFFRNNKIDVVIHSAGKPGHRNASDTSNLFYTNTKMFLNLEKHHEEYEKMLVMGSGAIYDMRYYLPRMKEEYFGTHIPVDEHGLCKYTCEKIIEKSNNIIDLRIFGIFGKHEDYAIRFISNMICKNIFNLPMTMRQNKNFSYLYINDLMPILEFFIENDTEHKAYNITPDETFELMQLANMINEAGGKNLPVVPSQNGFGLSYTGDNNRLKETHPQVTFTPMKEAIEELYQWYRNQEYVLDKSCLMYDK